ncbi:RTA1 like protein-domain-containing protein [Aspergillus pseudodeflectus]|uniref:RTA1 like protein-domain-containing protein n=1 Tax=Aspergillus pseudodeflectus TaxID=176178 RepID=A0ABR4JQI6_9EURO
MSDPRYFVTFDPSANCTLELCSIDQSVYQYRPSLPANIAFIALFNLAMIIHIYLGIRWRAWWYRWCMILGCTHETAGYVVCITQAPVFFCAAIYVTLSQTINHFSPTLARFPTKYLHWIFIPADIILLALQGTGGGLSASSSGSSQIGVDIAMAGPILQVVMLSAFLALFSDFVIRGNGSGQGKRISPGEKLFFAFLFIAVTTTLVRCVFRADELKEGYSGDLISDEGLFIGLEGVLIVIDVLALCVERPGFVFGRDSGHEYRGVSALEVK